MERAGHGERRRYVTGRIEWLPWNAVRSEIHTGGMEDGLSLTGLLYRFAAP